MSGHLLMQYAVSCLVYVEEAASDEISRYSEKMVELARLAERPLIHVRDDPANGSAAYEIVSCECTNARGNTLLVAGGLLESTVTRVALSALMDGYDVFILSDWCDTAEPQHRSLFETRIHAKGGVVVSSRQAIRELAAQSGKAELSRALLGHLADG